MYKLSKSIIGLLLIFSLVKSQTEVSGVISTDVTWSPNNNPYIATGTIIVLDGAKLTIEQGVEIKFYRDSQLRIQGTIATEYSDRKNILFTSYESITFPDMPESWDGIFLDNSSESVIQSCIIENASYGIKVIDDRDINDPLIKYNTIQNCFTGIEIEGNRDGHFIIESNIIYNNNTGIHTDKAEPIITNNWFIKNHAFGLILYSGTCGGGLLCNNVSATVVNNVFAYSTDDYRYFSIGINNTEPIIENNLFYKNFVEQEIKIYNDIAPNTITGNNFVILDSTYAIRAGSKNINMENNWWGTTDEDIINSLIFDILDDSDRGWIDYSNYLTIPNTDAPPLPVENVLLTDAGWNYATLSWDPSPIDDLAGYKIYYDTDEEDFPYRFSSDVGNINTKTLDSFINKGRYFFAVVAYDNDGNESWFTKADQSTYLRTDSDRMNPLVFNLLQNHPNPFNPNTTISYNIIKDCNVELNIYDISGKLVTILQKEYQIKGHYSTTWDSTDDFGEKVGAGVYLYQLRAGDFTETKKMILLK